MVRKTIVLFLLLLSMFLITGCGFTATEQSDNQGQNQTEDKTQNTSATGLTSFQTKDIYGQDKNQDIFKDYSLTLVNVWGTFCGPCLEEMPYLGELQKEYEPKGVNVVGIVVDVQDDGLQPVDDQIKLAKEIAKSTGAGYTHLLMSQEMMDSVLNQFDAIPANFFVDSDGNIVSEFYIGSRSKADWIDLIEENIKNNENN